MTDDDTKDTQSNWGLFYQQHSKDLSKRKSIKVKLPLRQHIKLHALKLFTENNISETVEEALDGHFEELREAEGGEMGLEEAQAAAEEAAEEATS